MITSTSGMLHVASSSAAFNIGAAESVQHLELEDKQRGHRDRIESMRRLAEEENTIYIPEHGCDLLVGLSSVPDYSSALHDNHGSWYFLRVLFIL